MHVASSLYVLCKVFAKGYCGFSNLISIDLSATCTTDKSITQVRGPRRLKVIRPHHREIKQHQPADVSDWQHSSGEIPTLSA